MMTSPKNKLSALFTVSLICKFLMLLGVFLLVQGCSEPAEHKKADRGTQNQNQMHVLVLVPQYPDTDNWSAQGQEGAHRIEQQLNAQVTLLTGTDPKKLSQDKLLELINPSLTSGIQLIVGVGGQYEGFLRFLASEHPYIRMAIVGETEGNQRNFGAVAGRFDDIGYILGVVAYQDLMRQSFAAVTAEDTARNQSKQLTVGFIGGIPFKSYQKMAQAFDNAVNGYDQTVDVIVDWVGSFAAPDLAYQKAKILLDQGVQVLLINTGMGNAVIAELIKQYPDRRLLLVDTDERSHWNPEQVLATGIIDVAELISNSAKKVSAGHWYGQQEWFSFKENVALVKLNSNLVGLEQRQNIFMIIDQLSQGLLVPVNSSQPVTK